MMKELTVKNIENEGIVKMYTLQFSDANLSEFEKFVQRFKDSGELNRDYQIIIYALSKISNNGALERYFRPEGKMNDRVCALPVDSGKLRLYCLRITDKILIIGNGGLKGLGFGRSVAKNLYLPEPQNDFILAVLGEELGFIGFVILMLVYIILITRLIMIALKARDRLGFYLATGVAVMLGLQVIINVAVVTSSMPATGITLPFISYGGTSVWSFMLAIGIALNISKGKRKAVRR